MAEFYDPMLYMSTPDRPNTMGVVVELKEKVDGNVLRNVVESLRVRHSSICPTSWDFPSIARAFACQETIYRSPRREIRLPVWT